MAHVEIDARVGGSFRLAERRNGASTKHRGRYLEIVPPRRLVFTLREGRRARKTTRVTVEIDRRRQGCELRLCHEHLPPNHVHDVETRWTGILYGLGETLATHSKPALPVRPDALSIRLAPKRLFGRNRRKR